MKLLNFLIATCLTLSLSSCWIGDQDDPEILYDTTLIELLCQTPEISMFCEMIYMTPPQLLGESPGLVPIVAWQLQFAGREGVGIGSPGQTACPSNVETVFAPTNEAVIDFLEDFPHWNSIHDIPSDTMFQLCAHMIYTRGKLKLPNGTPECHEKQILGGPIYNMWHENVRFVTNDEGEFIFGSLSLSGDFATTPIISPDLSSSDGAVYIIHEFVAPFKHPL